MVYSVTISVSSGVGDMTLGNVGPFSLGRFGLGRFGLGYFSQSFSKDDTMELIVKHEIHS